MSSFAVCEKSYDKSLMDLSFKADQAQENYNKSSVRREILQYIMAADYRIIFRKKDLENIKEFARMYERVFFGDNTDNSLGDAFRHFYGNLLLFWHYDEWMAKRVPAINEVGQYDIRALMDHYNNMRSLEFIKKHKDEIKGICNVDFLAYYARDILEKTELVVLDTEHGETELACKNIPTFLTWSEEFLKNVPGN
jgi:hypothetical protein